MAVKEAAAYLRVNAGTIYRLLRRREIPAFRLGSAWRLDRQVIDRWINERSAGEATASALAPQQVLPQPTPGAATASAIPPVLKAGEACAYLGIPSHTLYRLIKSGELPGLHLGAEWRFYREEVEELRREFRANSRRRSAAASESQARGLPWLRRRE
jgi:excisionase family DNA binding protein